MADYHRNWMWSEACEMLARAERLHREFFQPPRERARQPSWEPPVDVLETEREVLVLVALPGVEPDRCEAAIDGADLVVAGSRVLPRELRTADHPPPRAAAGPLRAAHPPAGRPLSATSPSRWSTAAC